MEITPQKIDFNDYANQELLRNIIENTFETIIIHSDYKVVYINQSGADFLGASKEELAGAKVLDVFPDRSKEFIKERIRMGLEENITGPLIEQPVSTIDGREVEVELYCQPFMHEGKRFILSVLRDITSRKEQERRLLNEIHQISTPVVPVSDGISIIPLVGTIDNDKSNLLLETLPVKLKGESDIKYVILDFSGVYNIDAQVIEFLYKLCSIMKMLGINPVLSGIRPKLAQKTVELGFNISSIKSLNNVKEAVKYIKAIIE
ncbi:PAS domain S-box protein [Bacillus sp. SCS-153A]|uniref:PAS domain S-box protein n=1 Tax=Rossellomorea sedimentorum TaxID=3115294 RepID=UPI003905E58D